MLFEEWLANKSQPLILEGGASGHMMHPFNNSELTFRDFKNIIDAALAGSLNFEEEPTEKSDGQNLWVTIKNGNVLFARNKTETINPMTLRDIKDKFNNHPSETVRDTFTFAAEDLSILLLKLPNNKQLEIFKEGLNFLNMELIYSLNPNVINYDINVIQFHNITKTDGNGNIISVDRKPASKIQNILKKLKADIGNTFKIIPPRIIKLRKDIDYSDNKSKFIKKINQLQNKYNLKDTDKIIKYHEMWWIDFINKNFGNLPENIKNGLMLRWAYDDKKTLNFRSLAKNIDKDDAILIKKFDKKDLRKIQKENIRPFEDLFLELGSIVLKNASNLLAANPKKETERLRNHLKNKSKEILQSNDENITQKVISELDRLERIGGINSIFPTEGIVFKYQNKLYKLTGTFAAINSLLGIIRYGR